MLLMATSVLDLPLLLAIPFLPKMLSQHMSHRASNLVALPILHVWFRLFQWLRGDIPWPQRRSALTEVAAANQWAQAKTDELGSNGKLVLCGYSSGGHVA